MNMTVYSTENCPYCVQAKALLTLKNIEFKEVCVPKDMQLESFVSQFPGERTFPVIFNGEERIGGFTDLQKYFMAADLGDMSL